ncbi:hypothetical protein [Mycobacterium shigaense]|uniref:Uncharacterized protein n=1 Tax=Mycobacterium shigaense TaxID=722731 RepID=A0A1Z4EGI5_9MYCO|nr:hypothetical protein [Mycobacterium shigaense]PRI16729.1 hypothetical protein B2J96_03500 [Mycobacterium shigaense]BAX92036.1 hypothetical protein MSG_01883 [Mycobacterium shigaense]
MSGNPVWTVEGLSEETYRFHFLPDGAAAAQIKIVSATGDEASTHKGVVGIHQSFDAHLLNGEYRLRWRWIGGARQGTYSSVDFTVPIGRKSSQLAV